MKRIYLTLLLISFLILNCFSQINLNSAWHEQHFEVSPLYILSVKGHPDIYLDGVFTAYLSTIRQGSIQSMEVWKDSKSLEKFGDRGKNGVIQITLTDNTTLILTNDLFKKYNIKRRDRLLPIYVDNVQIPNPNKIYFDLSAIKSVIVETYKGTTQKIINITTDTAR